MILTPHAIVGAALANMFPNDPALGFGLAFASHYLLDLVPHTDYDISNFADSDTKTVKSIFKNAGAALHFLFIFADFIAAIFLCFLIFVRNDRTLLLTFIGIVGGLLPDFLQFLYYKFKKQPWIFFQKVHDKFHYFIKIKSEFFWGILFQIVLPVCALAFYFHFL